MDIHEPHAAKTWPEFFIELGTVVIGILIALALEQVVEWAHDRHRASEARETIRAEVALNLSSLDGRASTEPCVSRRLDEAQALILEASAGKPDPGPIWIGHPLLLAMVDTRFRAATEGGEIKLLSPAEQANYAAAYSSFLTFLDAEQREQAAWSDLRALEQQAAMTPVAAWQLQSAIQQARAARWTLEITAFAARQATAALGIKAEDAAKFKLASVCVPLHTPRAQALDMVIAGRPNHLVYDEP